MPTFMHAGAGWKLTLAKDAAELTQGDIEKFTRAIAADKRGTTAPEDNAKTLAAAIRAGWVSSVEPAIDPDNMDGLRPAFVKWCAMHIDRLYIEARTIPPE